MSVIVKMVEKTAAGYRCLCICIQEWGRINATNAARHLHNAARWNHTVARFTVVSCSTHINSAETRSTCARSADTPLAVQNYIMPISNSSTRPVRRCCEPMTSATSSSRPMLGHQRRTSRPGTPRHQRIYHLPHQPSSYNQLRTVFTTNYTSDVLPECLVRPPVWHASQ